jgi:hypothetical protein
MGPQFQFEIERDPPEIAWRNPFILHWLETLKAPAMCLSRDEDHVLNVDMGTCASKQFTRVFNNE